jgi:hypothetical protein
MNEMSTAADLSEVPGRAHHRRGSKGERPQQGGGAVYGLGLIGAIVYFAGSAASPREYVFALGKALVWPAILVHLALRRLGA